MKNLYAKNFDDADEVKNPPKAKAQIVKLGNVDIFSKVVSPDIQKLFCQILLSKKK